MKAEILPNNKDKNNKSILWASYLAATIVLMDLSSVNIALPTISAYYGLDVSQVSWLLMASMLSAASFALIAGRLIDTYKAQSILTIGFLIFSIGTISCFFVKNFEFLIIIRFFQGFGEALLYVVGPAYISKNLPVDKQQTAYGIWMSSTAIGISLGPVIGGFLISQYHWQSVFLINFTLSFLGMFMLLISGKFELPRLKIVKDVDYYGAIYSFIYLASLIYALSMTKKQGIGNYSVIVSYIVFIIFLVLFLKREKRVAKPIFNLKIFSVRNFNLAAIGFFLFFLVNVGSRFLRPFYFENLKLLSPQISGLLMMVAPLIMFILSPLAKSISKRLKHKMILILANVLLAASMFWFSRWNAQTAVWQLVSAMVLLGVSMGLYYPVNSLVGMQSLPAHQSGMGSAAIATSKSMGKLMGVLLFAVFFTYINSLNISDSISKAYEYTFLMGSIVALGATFLSFNLKNENPVGMS